MNRFLSRMFCMLSVVICVMTLAPHTATASDELLLGVHPYKSATMLQKSFSPLADYLSRVTGQRVRIVIAKNYQQHITQMSEDKLDIAFMGPVSYVRLVDQYGPKPILARLEINGSPTFQGHIISRATGSIKTIGDIKGKTFAFGDPESTMSHLVPRHMLWKAGIGAEDLAGFDFLGNHSNVAMAVLSGKYDAGAVKEAVFHKYESRGLHSVAATPQLSEHLFVARANMPKQKLERIRAALLTLHQQANGMKTLHAIKKTMTRLVPAKYSDYDNLRKILDELATIGVK
jgi:phosphonate transport system substrate-binding protein